MSEDRGSELAFQATVDAVTRTRRVLMLISAILAIGTFHLAHWYISWDLARIDARRGVVAAIQQRHADATTVTGSFDRDTALIRQFGTEADERNRVWGNRSLTVPLLGLPVAVTDFSIALMMVSTAVLLWLLFYQRRVEWCLTRLEREEGWGIAKGILEYHFILIGTHTSNPMRFASRGLVWGLPVLGVGFLLSDIYDLLKFRADDIWRLAFESPDFLRYVGLRLGLDVTLVIVNLMLGLFCYRAFRRAEKQILLFADED